MSIFTGLRGSTPVTVTSETAEQIQQQIFANNWTSTPSRSDVPLQQCQIEADHTPVARFHEETVLQRIDAVLSNVLDDIGKGVTPSIRAYDESTKSASTKSAGRWQLQLSLESSSESQRFCRAMAVLERIQVGSNALKDSCRHSSSPSLDPAAAYSILLSLVP